MSYYPWDVLDIESTTDKKLIKKAYARLLRENKPDEDPEGFMRINEAYNEAISQARVEKAGFYEYCEDLVLNEETDTDTEADWDEPDLDVIEPRVPVVLQQVELDSRDEPDDSPPFSPPHQSLLDELNASLENEQYNILDQENDDISSSKQSLLDELESCLDQEDDLSSTEDELYKFDHPDEDDDDDDDDEGIINGIYHLISTDNYRLDTWSRLLETPQLLLDKTTLEHASFLVFEFVQEGIDLDAEGKPEYIYVDDDFLRISAGIPDTKNWRPYTEVNLPLLLLFDRIFGWTQDWQVLEEQFGYDAFVLTDLLEQKKIEMIYSPPKHVPEETTPQTVGYGRLGLDMMRIFSNTDWYKYSEWFKGLIWPLIALVVFIVIKVLIVTR